MNHEKQREAIKVSIDRLFSDTSVSQQETAADLRDIIEHCEAIIDSLDLEE